MAGGFSIGGSGRGRRSGQVMQAGAMANLLTDMVFNLLIFFVVCASTSPESGRRQTVPAANKEQQQEQKGQNIEVVLTRTTVVVNTEPVRMDGLEAKMRTLLAGKSRPDDRVVVIRSQKDTPYREWIRASMAVENAGGVVALQLEEEQIVTVP